MKKYLLTSLLAFGLLLQTGCGDDKKSGDKAAAKHDHDHEGHDHGKIKAGPTGGRLLTEVEPHAEFFVTKDKKVEIRFVDDDNKVVAPADQEVTAILGDRAAPTKLKFTKDGDKLVSDAVVPEGNDYPAVVQIKVTADAKAVTSKFNLNMAKCPTCDNLEYACTCDHGAEEEGHDHEHKEGEAHDHEKEDAKKPE